MIVFFTLSRKNTPNWKKNKPKNPQHEQVFRFSFALGMVRFLFPPLYLLEVHLQSSQSIS